MNENLRLQTVEAPTDTVYRTKASASNYVTDTVSQRPLTDKAGETGTGHMHANTLAKTGQIFTVSYINLRLP